MYINTKFFSKSLSILCIIITCSGLSSLFGTDFTIVIPEENSITREDYTLSLNFDMKAKVGGREVVNNSIANISRSTTENTILEVSNNQITKMKVYNKTDGDQKEQSVISGKSYILEDTGDTITITTPEGLVPPEEELAAMESQYTDFENLYYIHELDGHDIKSKRARDIIRSHLYNELSETFNEKEGDDCVKKVIVKYKGITEHDSRECAQYGIKIAIVLPMAITETEVLLFKVTFKGTMSFDLANGWIADSKLEGPASAKGNVTAEGITMKIIAGGTFLIDYNQVPLEESTETLDVTSPSLL